MEELGNWARTVLFLYTLCLALLFPANLTFFLALHELQNAKNWITSLCYLVGKTNKQINKKVEGRGRESKEERGPNIMLGYM